ncbi:MAG: c-type cytochrome [Polyangiaceae bacterium]
MRAGPFATSVVGLAVAIGCGPKEAPEEITRTAVERGKEVFASPAFVKTSKNAYACATCHEAERGSGGDTIFPGAPLAGATKRTSFWAGAEVEFVDAVSQCAYWFMLKDGPVDPADADARALWAYLDSLPAGDADVAPQPFTVAYAVADVPRGDATRGEPLYRRACSKCHGAKGTGVGKLVPRASTLPDQTIADHPSDKYSAQDVRLVFVEKVRHGGFVGYGGQMPPLARERLSDQDLGDVLDYLGVVGGAP